MKRTISFIVCLMSFGFMAIFAQDIQLKGKITSSEDGNPLPGAYIVVKGTTTGTASDVNGNFELNAPSDATIMVSSIGFVTQEIAVEGQTILDIVLEAEFLKLDEVVVTAIGITRPQKSLGYSVQTVESEAISKANTSDVINSISAKTAGVSITSSAGTPGASTFITIRGAASITGNNEPLFVIDGLPIVTGRGEMQTTNRDPYSTGGTGSSSRSIDLNPEDIETMTVLKGGAATALYGVRAANGVIVITTKSGKKNINKTKVELHSSVGFDKISQVAAMQHTYVQGNNGNYIGGHQRSWGPNVDTLQYKTDPTYKWDKNGTIVGLSDTSGNGIPVKMYDAYDFFETGITYNNRLSVSSGNDFINYFLSLGDLEQTGIVPKSKFARTNVRLNASAKLTKRATLSSNMTYSNSRAHQIQQGSNTSGVMLGLVRTTPSFDNSAGYEFPDGTQRNYRNGAGYDNPYWTVNKNGLDDETNRFIGNAIFNYAFTSYLSLSYNVGIDWYTRKRKDILAKGSMSRPAGAVEEGTYISKQFNSDLLLAFRKKFGEIGTSFTLGNNLFSTGWQDLWGDANGLEIPGFYQLSNSSDNQTGFGQNKYRTAALFGDLQLDFREMVYLGVTGRNDWSTTMPEKNRSAFYPSVSLGFVFTEIPGLKDNNILSFGKLRASWAKTANIADPYNTSNYYYPAQGLDGWTNGVRFPYMGTTGFAVNYGLGNPDLKHETMVSTEFGADLRFLKGRLGIDVAYFINKNSDLLLDVPIAPSSGYGQVYLNAGEMETKGIEITLNALLVQGKVFKWDVMANFSKMDNQVISLAEGVESIQLGGFTTPQTRAVAGKEYGSIYGTDWYKDAATGKILINDDPTDAYRDGYPMPDDRQMVPIGVTNPDWTANITNTLSAKGVTLSFLLDIRVGGEMYNGTVYAMNYFGVSERTMHRDVYYTPEGTIDFARTPAENIKVFDGIYGHVDAAGEPVSSGVKNASPVVLDENWFEGFGSNFGGGAEAQAIEPTDWYRLREITLSYQLPIKKVLQSAEIYFSGRNLLLITPYSGIDPETNLQGAINGQGMDYFNMPGTKTYTFGLKLSF